MEEWISRPGTQLTRVLSGTEFPKRGCAELEGKDDRTSRQSCVPKFPHFAQARFTEAEKTGRGSWGSRTKPNRQRAFVSRAYSQPTDVREGKWKGGEVCGRLGHQFLGSAATCFATLARKNPRRCQPWLRFKNAGTAFEGIRTQEVRSRRLRQLQLERRNTNAAPGGGIPGGGEARLTRASPSAWQPCG